MADLLRVEGIYSQGFGMLSKKIMRDRRIHVIAKSIYAYIITYAGAGETAFPGREMICSDLGINKNTYTKYLGQLKDYDYVRIEQSVGEKGTFGNNIFTIVSIPAFPENEIHPNWQKEKENAKLKNKTVSQEIGHGNTTEQDVQPCPISPYTVKWDTNNNNIFNNNNIYNNNNDLDTNYLLDNNEAAQEQEKVVVVVENTPEQKPEKEPLVSEVREALCEIDPELVDESHVEIWKKYEPEKILQAVAVLKQQKQVESVTGFLIKALENGWKPGKVYKGRASPNKVRICISKLNELLGEDSSGFIKAKAEQIRQVFEEHPEQAIVKIKKMFDNYKKYKDLYLS
ncbi:helix-turn-helix domain-containing protein [Zhaonella formicivorans]|uniref:helix-turn-helix domain-containing protein n=1 Tax=Zhaonella formicivorans TaxID=2528593 RepID=UPI0010E8AAAD|nr:helix-turn-helix domain-containing protein [Zhaonella formicivorans]